MAAALCTSQKHSSCSDLRNHRGSFWCPSLRQDSDQLPQEYLNKRFCETGFVGDLWLFKDVHPVIHRESARQSETERVAPVQSRFTVELLEVSEQVEIGVEQQPSHPDVADDCCLEAGLVEVFLFGVNELARRGGVLHERAVV